MIFRISVLSFLLSGCLGNAAVLELDQSAHAIELSEARAKSDLTCQSAKAGKTLRSEHLTGASEPLYSLYRVWVEGCDRHTVYQVACDGEGACTLSKP